MKVITFLVPVIVIIENIECLNPSHRYFLAFDLSNCPGRIGRNLKSINNTLCFGGSPLDVNSTVTCFLQYKVVGEPRTFVVADVENNAEFERRLFQLSTKACCVFKYESDTLVDYGQFARFLGVDGRKPENNPLANVTEALWCEFGINFGEKNATESLAIWKQEAELVFKSKNMGVAVEIFKTLGERKVHVFVAMEASAFDLFLFNTPFNQNIPNTLSTKCKTVIDFKTALSRLN